MLVKFISSGLLTLAIFSVLSSVSPAWSQERVIKIDGSSTVYPITEAVAEEFQKAKKGTVKVTVGISGTGGGFKKFSRGETDISDASRPITQKEIEACKEAGIEYIELPVAYDGLAVMVNPKNTWVTSMTVAQLKRIWEPAAQGKVTKWSYVNSAWPDVPLKLYGPGVDSRRPSTILPRPSSASPGQAGATLPPVRTTMYWYRGSPRTRAGWGISAMPTMRKTRIS